MSDYESWCNLLRALAVPDNTVRRQAEEAYFEAQKSNVALVLQHTTQALRMCPDVSTRTMAAVLLRGMLLPTSQLWPKLPEEIKAALREHIIAAMGAEQVNHIRRKVCHCVAAIAANKEPWPGLVENALRSADPSNAPAQRVSGLFLVSLLCMYAPATMRAHRDALGGMLSACLAQADLSIRVAAVKASVSFITALEPSDRQAMAGVTKPMLETISIALNAGREDDACTCMEELLEVIRIDPTLLQSAVTEIGRAVLMVTSAESLDDQTRRMAIEFVIYLAERAPFIVRQHAEIVSATLPVALNLIAEVEEDEDWVTEPYDERDDVLCANTPSATGAQAISRLSTGLGAATVLPVAFPLLPQYAGDSSNWKRRYAGLIATSELSCCQGKELKRELPKIVAMVLSMLRDPHPRVQYAALQALRRFAEELSDGFQRKNHAQVVPALIAVMAAPSLPLRVRAHAAMAAMAFCHEGECPATALKPYLGKLLEALFGLLQTGQASVQEVAVTTVGFTACAVGSDFAAFYDVFMAPMKGILRSAATSAEQRTLRGKVMECVGFIAESVGSERFATDANEVMQALVTTQQSLQADDPQAIYIMPACVRICKCIGNDFTRFLPFVLPFLQQTLSKKVEYELDAGDEEDLERGPRRDGSRVTWAVKMAEKGIMKMSLNVDLVDEKIEALENLQALAETLGSAFADHVTTMLPEVTVHVGFPLHEGVRSAAAEALAGFLKSVVDRARVTGDASTIPPLVAEILNVVCNELVNEQRPGARGSQVESLAAVFKALYESGGLDRRGKPLRQLWTIPPDHVPRLAKLLIDELLKSLKRRDDAVDAATKEISVTLSREEAAELVEGAMEIEDDLLSDIIDAHGYLLKMHGPAFLPTFLSTTAPVLAPMLDAKQPARIRWAAVCMLDDAIEFCGPDAQQLVPHSLPVFVQCVEDEDEMLRLAAVYGLAQIAEYGGAAFKPHAAATLRLFMSLACAEDAREEENGNVTDNALSGILKICTHHPETVDVGSLLPQWLSMLPLRDDELEAKLVHDQLCDMVEAGNAQLLGAGMANAPQVLRVFSEVLAGGNGGGEEAIDMASDETKARIGRLVAGWQQRMGQAFMQAVAPLTDHQRSVLAMAAQGKFA